ncbi:MAG: hypothetical protein IPP49_18785 [Saprospiraceae bacterium]|nr:hypothetical protein [Saprospiraceae bacterium]
MRFIFLLLVTVIILNNVNAQVGSESQNLDSTLHSEIAFHLYGSNYQGDLVQTDIWYFPETKLALGISYRLDVSNNFRVSAKLSGGSIAGTDKNFEDRKNLDDNLNFKSTYIYGGISGEWYPWGREKRIKYYNQNGEKLDYHYARYSDTPLFNSKKEPMAKKSKLTFVRKWMPFASGGLVILYNNPTIGSNGPTATPWETLKEKNGDIPNVLLGISIGGGLRYNISEKYNVGADFSLIYLFSDYADGWSKVRDPQDPDWITQAGLSFGYRF